MLVAYAFQSYSFIYFAKASLHLQQWHPSHGLWKRVPRITPVDRFSKRNPVMCSWDYGTLSIQTFESWWVMLLYYFLIWSWLLHFVSGIIILMKALSSLNSFALEIFGSWAHALFRIVAQAPASLDLERPEKARSVSTFRHQQILEMSIKRLLWVEEWTLSMYFLSLSWQKQSCDTSRSIRYF